MKTKIVSWLLALAMLLSLMPVSAFAADRDPDSPQVRVIVENTTYTTDMGAPWDGTLVDTWVDINEDSSIASCLVAALDEYGYTQSGAEYGYVGEINGIQEFSGSGMGGWMVTLNDWFINEGVDMFTVAAGKLEPGDEVKIMYSNAGYGEDLGGTWSNNDKTVKNVQFSAGTLDQPFSADVDEYVLTLPAGTTGVVVTPTATNKNFQVRAYGDDGTEYKRNDTIPVADGDILLVICGDPEWPSMNSGDWGSGAEDVPAEIYLFEVVVEASDPDLFFTVDLSSLTGLTGQLYEGGIVSQLLEDEDSMFWDHSAAEGEVTEYAFAVTQYDQYIVYLDFYMDSDIVGWNINGTSYFPEDTGEDQYWNLGGNAGAGYIFGLTDEQNKEFAEFYLCLGETDSYNTPGSWNVKPLVLTEEIFAVIDAIAMIDEEITPERGRAISYARTLYDALSDTDKEILVYLGMLDILETAEDEYNALLTDKAVADAVIAKIDAIGTVTLEDEAAITAARAAYDALTDKQKALVANYEALTAAEATLVQLKEAAEQAAIDQAAADAVEEKIDAIGTVTVFSGKKISAARAAYDALTGTQKALVENAAVLIAAEDALKACYKAAANTDHNAIYQQTGKYIANLGTPSVGDTGGEWMIIDLLRAGRACPAGYFENVVKYVQAEINDKEQLHRAKGTDNSRMILALTAAGYDVTNVAGHNLLMGLTDMTYVQYQGINGPIWALIAFDSHGYEIPVNPNAAEQVTREKLIAYILDKQLDDGGWALAGNNADADMTGMALQALAPYYSTNAEVKTAVDAALVLLSEKQNDMGGFGSVDGYSTESCAQIIVALAALGIDPEADLRFVKNGISVVDAMCQLAIENGGFAHIPGGNRNGMATEQGQYALAAYFRFVNGQTALYDMSDVLLRSNNEGAGKVENTTDSEDNAHNAALDTPTEELDDKLLTEEEQKLVENGVSVYVKLTAKDISSSVSDADKLLVREQLGENTVGMYLDITLTKQLGDAAVKITETAGAVIVTVTVPKELRNTDPKMLRIYKIIRVHEGTANVLDASFDEKTGKLAFETDCFSTYALVYADTPVSDIPTTGDNTQLALMAAVLLLSLCSVAVVISYKKHI